MGLIIGIGTGKKSGVGTSPSPLPDGYLMEEDTDNYLIEEDSTNVLIQE